mgnify:CR=1 FL=1
MIFSIPSKAPPQINSIFAVSTLERKTGARGLRSVLENSLQNLMYKIPSDHTVEKIIITEDAIRNGAEPIILRNPKKESKKLTVSTLKNA